MENSSTAVVEYFGKPTIEKFIKYYFDKHGLNKETRNELMALATLDHDTFLDLICDFLDKEGA